MSQHESRSGDCDWIFHLRKLWNQFRNFGFSLRLPIIKQRVTSFRFVSKSNQQRVCRILKIYKCSNRYAEFHRQVFIGAVWNRHDEVVSAIEHTRADIVNDGLKRRMPDL